MTTLPEHRRIINGRTFSRSWNPADMDPMPRARSRASTTFDLLLSVALASSIGIAFGALLVYWLST